MSIEKFHAFRHRAFIEREYRLHVEDERNEGNNERQKNLLHKKAADYSLAQLSFRYFFTKEQPDSVEQQRQIFFILTELIEVLYGHAAFFKDLEAKRPAFVREMLEAFMESAQSLKEEEKVKELEEVSRVKLQDQELQKAFYKMLKGTVSYSAFSDKEKREKWVSDPAMWEKSYPSLLRFLHKKGELRIYMHRAPRELLLAIYGKEEIVDKLMVKRKEYLNLNLPNGPQLFKEEFEGLQKPDISMDILDFSLGKRQ